LAPYYQKTQAEAKTPGVPLIGSSVAAVQLGPNLCYTSSQQCLPVQLGYNCPIRSREKVTLGFFSRTHARRSTGFTGSHRVIHSRSAWCIRTIVYSINRNDLKKHLNLLQCGHDKVQGRRHDTGAANWCIVGNKEGEHLVSGGASGEGFQCRD
jgi:hypothetical protein